MRVYATFCDKFSLWRRGYITVLWRKSLLPFLQLLGSIFSAAAFPSFCVQGSRVSPCVGACGLYVALSPAFFLAQSGMVWNTHNRDLSYIPVSRRVTPARMAKDQLLPHSQPRRSCLAHKPRVMTWSSSLASYLLAVRSQILWINVPFSTLKLLEDHHRFLSSHGGVAAA